MSGEDAPHRTSGVVVELVGLPGAGKSHWVRLLTTALTERGVPVVHPQTPVAPTVPTAVRLLRKAAMCAAALVRRPGASRSVLGALRRSKQQGRRDISGRAVQWLVGQHLTATAARSGGIALLDEGPVQALWSIGLRGEVDTLLTTLGHTPGWYAPIVLLVVRAKPETVLERLAARKSQHSRTQLLDETAQLAELHHGSQLLDHLVDWWSALPGSRPVIEVSGDDGQESTDEVVHRILDGTR